MSEERFQYGGMAVLEGVMMRGPQEYCIAVRKADGSIVSQKKRLSSIYSRFPVLKLPIIRGIAAFVDSLVLGMSAITYSANQFAETEEEELSPKEIVLAILMAFGFAVLLFVIVPTVAVRLLPSQEIMPIFLLNFLEGLVRLAVFLIYIFIISRLKDFQRMFAYHGAEHKVISAYEAGEDLSVENVRKYTTRHPRCGTSFLLIVMLVSILVFSLLRSRDVLFRILMRIILLPLVAGLAYEVIKIAGRSNNKLVKLFTLPGLWLQALTTREPDDAQLEVAITALKGALIPRITAKEV
ncbi:MAG TPA: DUF1385 domain-containing protein [Clostridia bacterium]|jgi:uncharacterized protein YqhQ|nr:DUF1385 domain-containing protein [Clostridia bacterium]